MVIKNGLMIIDIQLWIRILSMTALTGICVFTIVIVGGITVNKIMTWLKKRKKYEKIN